MAAGLRGNRLPPVKPLMHSGEAVRALEPPHDGAINTARRSGRLPLIGPRSGRWGWLVVAFLMPGGNAERPYGACPWTVKYVGDAQRSAELR